VIDPSKTVLRMRPSIPGERAIAIATGQNT
jgi:hypothetical protein